MRRGLVVGVVLLIVAVALTQERGVPPLPPSATPVPDRVSVEDATAAASKAAVLSAPLPRREAAMPYVRPSVPAPQEFRESAPLEMPPEPTAPVTGTPRLVPAISGSGAK